MSLSLRQVLLRQQTHRRLWTASFYSSPAAATTTTTATRGSSPPMAISQSTAQIHSLPLLSSSSSSPSQSSSPSLLIPTTPSCRFFSNRKKKSGRSGKKKLMKQALQKSDDAEDEAVTTNRPAPKIVVTQTQSSGNSTNTQAVEEDDDDEIIMARRPDEDEDDDDEEFVGKQAMPDMEKEKQLGQLQTQVSTLYKNGQYQKGLEAAELALRQVKNHFGEHHPATASAHTNVGLMHKQLGHYMAAKQHYEKALQAYQETVGTDHASYANVLHNLGMLLSHQIHVDSALTPVQRLAVIEQAMEALQTALHIRQAELPPEHPHIVATQSALGSTVAAHILHHHKRVTTLGSGGDAASSSSQAQYVPLTTTITPESWATAERDLRQALQTALQHPRGESCLKRTDKHHYLNLQRKYNLQQKQQHKKSKKKLTTVNKSTNDQDIPEIPMQTNSAATAAQNLAVFLKARATTLKRDDTSDSKHTDNPQWKLWTMEAQTLYEQALEVRSKLLPKGHAELYLIQYSLAELYDYTGQTSKAQDLRQVIIDTYDPPTSSTTESSTADENKKQDKNSSNTKSNKKQQQ